MNHPTTEELEAGLPDVLKSPQDQGTLEMVIRRPETDAREVLDEAELTLAEGVKGDNWNQRPNKRSADGGPHPDMQLNVMNSRIANLVSGGRDRWALAGDQLYVDFDITAANVPPGTRLAIGSAVIEVTDQPHTGCAKFTQRFGLDAHRFVNSPDREGMHLRGINARVVSEGTIKPGDHISKLDA
ncbi:MAG: MOSC domain-containing protein [Acidimicrobiales bacterium]